MDSSVCPQDMALVSHTHKPIDYGLENHLDYKKTKKLPLSIRKRAENRRRETHMLCEVRRRKEIQSSILRLGNLLQDSEKELFRRRPIFSRAEILKGTVDNIQKLKNKVNALQIQEYQLQQEVRQLQQMALLTQPKEYLGLEMNPLSELIYPYITIKHRSCPPSASVNQFEK